MVSALVVAAPLLFASIVRADDTVAPPPPVPAKVGTPAAADDLPLRFRDMLAFEADRARPERLFNGIIGSISSTGLIAAGAISLATADSNDANAGVVRSYGYVMVSIGGTALLASLIGMIPRSSAEKLLSDYEPIAEDKRYDPEWRVRRGEDALRAQAKKDAMTRVIYGVVNIIAGLGVAGIAIWRATWSGITPADRAISGTLTGASSVLAIGQGVGRIWFQRGSAEVAFLHWQASQGRMRDVEEPPKPAAVSFSPLLMPIPSGFVGGIAAEF